MKKIFSKFCAFMVVAAFAMPMLTSCHYEDDTYDEYEMDLEEEAAKQGISVSGNVHGFTYVDLGLSVKWATCNVGAKLPYEYGKYFSWGGVKSKSTYNWGSYEYGTSSSLMKKYCFSENYGDADDKDLLENVDDAANQNMSSAWRIPTTDQWNELFSELSWSITWNFDGTGTAGVIGTASNGNQIFFPAAGYYDGSSSSGKGDHVMYWTSILSGNYDNEAYYTNFTDQWNLKERYRYYGLPVRAVVKK